MKIPKPDPSLLTTTQQTLFLNPGETVVHFQEEGETWLALPDRPYSVIPFRDIRALVAFGHVAIAPETIPALLAHKIPVVLFAGDGSFLGRMEPALAPRSDLLHRLLNLEDEKRFHLTQRIVWGVLRQYRRFLQRCDREGAGPMADPIQQLDWAIKAVTRKTDLHSALGCRGAGMAAYYKAGLPAAVRVPGWDWTGRDGATPLNAMLSFAYRLIEQGMTTAIAVAGLDLHTGIWRSPTHQNLYGLVQDLAAEFYVFADAIVLRAINRRQVALKDFDEWAVGSEAVPPLVRETLVREYAKKMGESFVIPYTKLKVSYQEMMVFQARQLAEYLSGNVREFCPVSVK